jgi:hypothetical protein
MEVQQIHLNVRTFLSLALLGFVLGGCQSSRAQSPQRSAANVETRNNAASLLYDLLGDEKNVSKLLIIKRDREELLRVIKDISKTAGEAHKKLERLAKEDSTLNLKNTALPPGEKATREAESKARAGELLHASGADFEFKLLLTQAEALNYAKHLAEVAAQNEPQAARANVFREISGELRRRHGEILELLRPQGNTK